MTISRRDMLAIAALAPLAAMARPQPDPPPDQESYSATNLDALVARVALYPDSLLSQVLAASTFPEQIPGAARWADEHAYLQGDGLARAIQEDELPWDPSVQALLPFRSVLDTMAADMSWTSELGNAFLQSRDAVMDAVQRRRREAEQFGYLRSNNQIAVTDRGGYVEIDPVNPAFIPVPVYDPGVVFVRPRAGLFAGGAITFGGISIGAAFAPWGWGHSRFDWDRHNVIIENHPWDRRWENRREYVHPYEHVHRYQPGHNVERHDIRHDDRRSEGRRVGDRGREEHAHDTKH